MVVTKAVCTTWAETKTNPPIPIPISSSAFHRMKERHVILECDTMVGVVVLPKDVPAIKDDELMGEKNENKNGTGAGIFFKCPKIR